MLYYLPIEPYETRYTADWIDQFESEFDRSGVHFKTITGDAVSSNVSVGGVLDTCGTHIYKFSQLAKVMYLIRSNQIKDNDVIFFADLWFPGIESLFYVRNMTGIKFKICGILHAGTYDKADFTYRSGMRSWGKHLESCWLSDLDTVFVATQFHKDLILDNLYLMDTVDIDYKIYVTGLPFYGSALRDKYISEKENIVVFPHRMDIEKHPELFDQLVSDLSSDSVDFKPVRTIVETESREEYFKVLGKSKVMVSFADQETFGYSTLESMALGNIVIVPNKLSYRETVPADYRYDDVSEVLQRVKSSLINYADPLYDISKWEQSIFNMISCMRNLGYGV